MKIQDLRVGNYVLKGAEICEVKGIDKIRIEILRPGYHSYTHYAHIEYLDPIPLTEEILLKCGFKHKGNGFYEITGSFIELCNIGDELFNCGFKGVTIKEIYHLNQLQNFYYMLTGKELNYNE